MRDLGSIPGLGRSPGGGHGNPLQYSCLENPHGQRSLAGYIPWSLKKSDTTELSTHYWWNGRLRAFERKNPDTDPHIFGQLNFDKDDTTEKQVKESVF